MKCPTCGAPSDVLGFYRLDDQHRVNYFRACERGHKFITAEVHPTQLADVREMSCAVRNIRRRISRWHRDEEICRDKRPSREVAEEYNLTDTRVRQIRAAMRELTED